MASPTTETSLSTLAWPQPHPWQLHSETGDLPSGKCEGMQDLSQLGQGGLLEVTLPFPTPGNSRPLMVLPPTPDHGTCTA